MSPEVRFATHLFFAVRLVVKLALVHVRVSMLLTEGAAAPAVKPKQTNLFVARHASRWSDLFQRWLHALL